MTDPATSWIEAAAIEKWWNRHRLELKQMVTVERVRLAEENEELKKELVFVRAVVEKCTPNNYARDQAELERLRKQCAENEKFIFETGKHVGEKALEVEKLKNQVAQLERMKGVQWRK